MIELDKIYNEDCLEGMNRIPDGRVDLIVTDPPYLIHSECGGGILKKRDYLDNITDKKLNVGIDERFLEQMVRIMKKVNIYIFCSKNQLGMYFNFFQKYNCDILVWHKLNPIPMCNNKYLSDLEYIFFVRENGVPIFGTFADKSKLYQSVVNKEDLNKYGHPTIKPLQLVRRFVCNSSEEGATICDPFMGSGTTAVACIREKRHFIGFELNKEYFDKACKRIDAERRQLTLF